MDRNSRGVQGDVVGAPRATRVACSRRTFAGMMGALAGTAFASTAAGQAFLAEAAEGETQSRAAFTPGTYTASTYGMLGAFDVTSTFSADSLESLEVGENSETKRVAKRRSGFSAGVSLTTRRFPSIPSPVPPIRRRP